VDGRLAGKDRKKSQAQRNASLLLAALTRLKITLKSQPGSQTAQQRTKVSISTLVLECRTPKKQSRIRRMVWK
jgi:hypothetical protein